MNNGILLEHIDKDQRNFFNADEEFFLFDNDNLTDIRSRLYGWTLQSSGIYENENLTQEAAAQIDGSGCYVYVDVKDDEITIKQDFNGSWGIYIFQHKEYFALSNSFFRLLEYIKRKYPISLDRDYCNHFIALSLASHAYSETPVKEIKLIPRNAIIKIIVSKKLLQIDYIDYHEANFSLNSLEGITILDRWFERWTSVFRKLKEKTENLSIDLSGGFDSRLTFLLLLCSGINLDEITVNSNNSNLHTFGEDYKIASSIAEYYGFKLNCDRFSGGALNYSIRDIINIAFYTKMGFHKHMYWNVNKYEKKTYEITGFGGGPIRAFWDVTADKFIQDNVNICERYPQNLAKEMGDSVVKILNHACEIIGQKFHIDDPLSIEYPRYLYGETRCRNHFGKLTVERYFSNRYILQPLVDSELRKLRLSEPECPDNNLLMAMIYVRYCPKLLEFEVQGNRSISQSTIEFANSINKKYPYSPKNIRSSDEDFNVITTDAEVTELLKNNNKYVPGKMAENYLKRVFDSVSFRKLFAMYFDEEIYGFAKQSYEKLDFHPMRDCYCALAIGKVIEDVLVSENTTRPMLTQNLDYFIQNNYYTPKSEIELLEKFKDYITARIDIQLKNNHKADFEIADISDAKAKLLRPVRLQNDGTCVVLESYTGSLDIILKMKTEGELTIELKSRFVWGQDKDTDRIPYWIDYHLCKINGIIEFSDIRPAWHDQPIYVSRLVTSGDELKLHLEWSPHRSDMV